MAWVRWSVTNTLVAGCAILMWLGASVTSPVRTGAIYTCDPGEVHKFWVCEKPDKPPPQPCTPSAGNPVDVLTGRKHQEVLDWSSGGSQPLELKRTYSSSPFMLAASPYSSVGRGWRTNFDARARWSGATLDQADWVHVVLPDHFEYHFNKQSGVWRLMQPQSDGTSVYPSSVTWTPRTDLDASLAIDGQWIVFRTPDDTTYVFDSADHVPDVEYRVDGLKVSLLSEIRFRGGYVQKLSYSVDYLIRVADNLGRWMEFDYARPGAVSVLASQVRTSDGKTIKYGYENRFPALNVTSPVDFWALSTVTYPDATPADDTDNPRVRYEYLDVAGKPGLLLTGMVDERGVRFASWTYDSRGRALSSEHAGGADRWQFAYDDAGNSVTVTNPLGRTTVYRYRKLAGALRQLLAVDGVATAGCAASNTQYTYDANGFRSRAVDAEGRVTLWTRDAAGRPLAMTEAAGATGTRSTEMTWSSNRPLLLSRREPLLDSSFTYGGEGQLNAQVQVDRNSRASRTVGYAYSAFQLEAAPVPKPSGPPLPDVPLTVVNSDAGGGLAGWTNAIGRLRYLTTSPCSVQNPCFGASEVTSSTNAYQDIAIPPALIADVDRRARAATISWRQWGGSSAGVHLYFIDASGREFDARMSEWKPVQAWQTRRISGSVPAGTRVIRVKMQSYPSSAAFDDISLALLADGPASANPFLSVSNSMGLSALQGWTVVDGSVSAGTGCGINPCFWNDGGAEASLSQDIVIPADRAGEVDRGERSLEVQWLDGLLSGLGFVQLTASFLDSSGQVLANGTRVSPQVASRSWSQRAASFSPIPARARKIRLTFRFLRGPGGGFLVGLQGVTAQLLPRRAVDSRIELLSAVDGPLPGAADTVRYGYDVVGRLTSVTNELGQVTRITRLDAGGRPLSVTDPNGVVTNLTYDARGRLTTVTVNPGAAQARTVIAYDASGQVTRVTSPDGSYLQYSWSDARRLTAVTNNGNERIDYGYNANGDVTSRSVKSASGAIIRQQSALFDELGRLMRSIGASGQETRFTYDRTDNLTQVQDPRGGLFGYAYDALQNLASLTDQTGGSVRLTRDAQGAVTAYSDARGLTTSYVRNGFGDIIRETGPDVGTTAILRDERGLATRITDPRGVVTLLSYDAAGRLVQEAYPADPAQNVSYSYDDTTNGNKGLGRLTGIVDASGAMARYYDALGRVIAEARMIAGKTYSTAYAYNAAGRLTAITYPSGRVVSYTRNGLGRVTAVATRATAADAPLAVASGIGWSPMSTRVTALTHGNGLVTTRSYDGDGRLTGQKVMNGSTRVADLAYAYADGMNLTAVNDNVMAANSLTLAYDAAQRLAYARGPWGALSYGYTPNGDRSQEVLTPPGGGKPLTTDLRYPATSNRLAATAVGSLTTRSFAYDAAGNLTAQVMGPLRLAFAYNLRNRPVSLTRTGDGTQVSRYLYNALEQMVSRSTNAPGGPAGTVHYIYGLDGSLLAEADAATGATLRDYIWLPQGDASPAADNDNEEGANTPPLPLALVTGVNTASPDVLMVHADHLGRPVRLTDATRATVWAASYDPFGQPISIAGAIEQNLRFPGQYFLIESGLSYNWHRLYDPATGRYTQPDPLRFVDGPSVYGYSDASPIMRVDRSGLCAEDACVVEGAAFCTVYPQFCIEVVVLVADGCKWLYDVVTVPGSLPPLSIEPPDNAWDPNGPKAPGYPGDVSPGRPGGYPGGIPGYEDPKDGPDWVPNPNGPGNGWRSKDGKVWVPTGPRPGRAHGGPHWDVQDPRNKKRYGNIRPPKTY